MLTKKITDDGGNEIENPKYDANRVGKNEAKIVIPLKYLSNFLRTLDIPLINCRGRNHFNLDKKLHPS